MWFLRWVPTAIERGLDPFVTHQMNAPTGVNLMWNAWAPLIGLALAPVTVDRGPCRCLQRGDRGSHRPQRAGVLRRAATVRRRPGRAARRRRGVRLLALRRLAGGPAPEPGRRVGAPARPHRARRAADPPPARPGRRWAWPSGCWPASRCCSSRRSWPRGPSPPRSSRASWPSSCATARSHRRGRAAGRPRLPPGAGRPSWSWRACRSRCSSLARFGSAVASRTRRSSRRTCSTSCCRRRTSSSRRRPPPGSRASSAGCITRPRPTSGCRCWCILVVVVVRRWSDLRIRVAGLMAAAMFVLSLGQTLRVGNMVTGPAPAVATDQPAATPRARPARQADALHVAGHRRHRGRRRERGHRSAACRLRTPRLAVLVLALALILPAPMASSTAQVPEFFRSFDRQGIADDAIVLVAPHFTNGAGAAPMLWAAVAGDRPRLYEAYAYVPDADGEPAIWPGVDAAHRDHGADPGRRGDHGGRRGRP